MAEFQLKVIISFFQEDKMFSKTLRIIAAASLLTASSVAIAQSEAPGAVAIERAGAVVDGESELRGRGAGIYIIGAIALGLIIWGIIELTSDDDDDFPTSP